MVGNLGKTMDEKLKIRLGKLMALARTGVGGEKVNADNFLVKLLDKHNLTLTDIVDSAKTMHFFSYRNAMQRRLLGQVIYSVCGSSIEVFKSRSKRSSLRVEVTRLEQIEIEILYGAYKAALKVEIELLVEAFIHKNGIFASADGVQEPRQLSAKEMERMEKVLRMMEGLDKVQVRKALA